MLEDLYSGVAPPGGLPPPLPPGWTSTPVDPSTDGFHRLYRGVTEGIDGYAHASGWQPFEALFFDCAVAGFLAEYKNWSKKPAIHYLNLFRTARYRALQVVAHAYLHIAYDLPRVLVNHLDAAPAMRNAIAQGFPSAPTTVGVIIGRYLDLQEVMRQSLDAAGRDAEIFGKAAHLVRLLPGKSRFLEVFGNWVLVLRSNSLLYAQMVAEVPKKHRAHDHVRFQRIYDAAADVAANHPSNPFAWLFNLKTWFGAAMLPLGLFAQLQPITIPATWPVITGLSLLAVASVGFSALWVLDAWLASYADALGRAILKALTRPGTDNDNRRTRQPAIAQ